MYEKLYEIAGLFKKNGIILQVPARLLVSLKIIKIVTLWKGCLKHAVWTIYSQEFDTAWMICSKIGIREYLQKYKNHVDILHLKDYKPIPMIPHTFLCAIIRYAAGIMGAALGKTAYWM